MIRFITISLLVLLTIALDYPVAAFIQHGLNPKFWPQEVVHPDEWFEAITSMNLLPWFTAYRELVTRTSDAFANGGWSWQPLALPIATAFFIGMTTKGPEIRRDSSNIFGSARFANGDERAAMRDGLEFGLDPKTGCAVRASVEGTLVSIAPPRKGKSSGFVIPNLAVPERCAWKGPAVVIDPKGEVYRAVFDRRRALGRRVICFDPYGLVGGDDCWNPLANLQTTHNSYLLRAALALLPEPDGNSENAAYFRNKAADLVTGAMIAARFSKEPSVLRVHELLNDNEALTRELQAVLKKGRSPAASNALKLLKCDAKTREPIESTASQAFQWLIDDCMQSFVSGDSFDLSKLSTGDFDLFVVLPTENIEILAPFLRWFLSDLFNAVRRNRAWDRILVFIDETASLGRFSALLKATTELPGYGLSLWTFWQSRSQIVGIYGEHDAATILNTAEFVTLSDVSAVDPDEAGRWSQAIGNYTAYVNSWSGPTDGKSGSTKSQSSQPAPLMSREDLVRMSGDELLVFPNNRRYTANPLRLAKTKSYSDPRFEGLIEDVAPVEESG